MTNDDVIRATVDHVARVGELLSVCVDDLVMRGVRHDRSKFSEEEWPYFAKHTAALSSVTYGSDEYREMLTALRPAVDHHQSINRHHPEFFGDEGVCGMTLLDLLEMLCDWKAASERHADGDISRSLEVNAERFKMPDALVQILQNTVQELSWLSTWTPQDEDDAHLQDEDDAE